MRRALALGALAVLAGCGGGSGGTTGAPPSGHRSDRLVDFSRKPPYVNSLEQDAKTGDLLLTTNRGFFRIEDGKVVKEKSRIEAKGKTGNVGTFLELDTAADGSLVGSGHPDPDSKTAFPQYLGYLRSTDGGKNWSVVSRYGLADLHKIVFIHDRLYAWDAVLSAILISTDDGKTFSEHFTPRGLIIDFEVDPDDPDTILAATDEQLFRSTDGGDGWRPVLREPGVRMSWPKPDELLIATKDGRIQVSKDSGDTYDDVGRVDGEPYVLKTDEQGQLLALSDGTVLRSGDDGAKWKTVFAP